MQNQRLGFGVVGVNPRIRRTILGGIAGSARARVAGVCSRDASRAAEAAAEFGGQGYTSLNAMLENPSVDAVFVCTPHALHAPMSLAVLAAGKRIVCEKPLALDVDEAERMVAAAERDGRPTVVNFTYHSLPGQSFVARLLEAGKIGRVTHLDLSYFQGRGALPGVTRADALFDVGSHQLDLATWWLDLGRAGRMTCVVAQEDERDREDAAGRWKPVYHAIGRTDEGALVTLQANRLTAGWRNGMSARLVGEHGSILLDFDTDRVEVKLAHFGDGCPEGVYRAQPLPTDLDVGYAAFPAYHIDRIVAALHGEIPFPDFAYGLWVQRLMDAVRRSSIERRWIDLETTG